MRRWLPLLLAAGALIALPAGAEARTVWLCKPGMKPNPCLASATTTVVEADGSTRVERTRYPRRPKIDCFYVYPTVSGQPTTNANKRKDPEILAVAELQASRFSEACRVYAPVYRQLTLAGIADGDNISAKARARAYRDVLEAWRTYLRRHDKGRGVVLVGHSQGTGMLRKLAGEQIDSNPELRGRLVSALLIGGNVTVRRGRRVGGDFRHIPACSSARLTGCVVAYSAFNQPPPAEALFGRPNNILLEGQELSKLEVLCVNPAALTGGRGKLRPYFPTERFPGALGQAADPPPVAPTPWVTTPGLYRARCASGGGANWLQIDDVGDPGDTRQRVTQSIGPAWGLHLVDVTIAQGNLVDLVKRQAAAYLRRARA
jgi:hypothetical protein